MVKEEILTEKILEICQLLEPLSVDEIQRRVDCTMEKDLVFNLTDRVYWWFVDRNDIYEDIDIDEIYEIVEKKYFNIIQ